MKQLKAAVPSPSDRARSSSAPNGRVVIAHYNEDSSDNASVEEVLAANRQA